MTFTFRQAFRSIVHAPVVSLVVVVCIALGAGAATTVFTWLEHLVRRPLPAVEAMDRAVSVVTRAQGREDGVSYPAYLEWRDSTSMLRGLAAFGVRQFGVRAAAESPEATQSTWGLLVSDNYFEVLGVRPISGRAFSPGESRSEGQPPVAVVSHRIARRFGGASGAIGHEISVNDVPMTVVGVTPSDFVGTYAGLAFDIWIPITMQPRLTGEMGTLQARDIRWLQAIGRLQDGASVSAALAELATVSNLTARTYPEDADREAFVKPLDTGAAQRLKALFVVLLGITALVALIACTNVATLLMLRGSARAEEIGIRLSLGASRTQIVTQLLAESTLLAAAGAAVGLLLARWAQGLLPALMPASPLPLALEAGLDARVLGFAVTFTFVMVLIFGIAPAIHTLRRAVLPGAGRTQAGATRSAARLRAILVVAQLALSMAALMCAGAFLRANASLAAVDRGLSRPDEVLLVSTDLDQAGYHTPDDRIQIAGRLLSGVHALPGVESAALATFVPLGFTGYSPVPVAIPGYLPARDEDMTMLSNRVSATYFQTTGIAILAGRPFDERDTLTSPRVAVVNDAFVQRFMPNTPAIGREIDVASDRVRIVGIAANGKYRFDALDQPSPPHVYLPYVQQSRAFVTLHVRTKGRTSELLAEIRRTFSTLNPALPLNSPTTLDEYTSLPLFPVRLGTTVLAWLGSMALLLSSAGLYGVLGYRVSQRRTELALRMALGASPASLIRLIVGGGVRQATAGVVVGTLLGIVATRLIAARLPRIQMVDPTVLALSAGMLFVVALLAAILPAVRATRVEPALALRSG